MAGFTMNRWVPPPTSGLICSLTALCTGLLFIVIILVVTTTRHGVDETDQNMEVKLRNLSLAVNARIEKLSQDGSSMMEKLTEMETFIKDMRASSIITKINGLDKSVNRILSDEVIGSITSDIQGVLGAVSILRDEIRKENNTDDPTCDIGWKHFKFNCYFFSRREKSWQGAKNDCSAKSANLVVINNEDENTFLHELSKLQTIWIGLTDEDGSWKWVDGTPYDTTPKFWRAEQPDNWFGHGLEGGEDCAQLLRENSWNDDHCSRRFPYICEKKKL